MENLTPEQEDELILEELNIESDNKSNADESIEDESVEDEADIEETEEESEDLEEDSEEEEESEEEIKEKKPNKFAKLLSQRNEARKQAEENAKDKENAITQVQELQAKLEKLEEDWDYWNEEYVNTLVEKKIAERDEVDDFFDDFDDLRKHKKWIIQTSKVEWLSLEKASKLYLAEIDPSLLLSNQAKAKSKSDMYKVSWRTNTKLKTWKLSYSDDEFEKMVSKGLIKF